MIKLLRFSRLIFLFAILLGSSCSKKANNNTPIVSGLKTAFNYQPGTYWVYKDSLSGRVDSFYITSNVQSKLISNIGNGTLDDINIAMTEKNIGSVFSTDTLSWIWFLAQNYAVLGVTGLPIILGGGFNYTPLITYPFTIGAMKAPLSACSDSYLNLISSTYNLNGNDFMNVAEITEVATQYNYIYDSFSDHIFVNADVGIIKMRLNHPYDTIGTKVWELQRWHIVK